jgi:cytosine/adenosine deaminase-related metal-dependent hydrolase
VKTIIRNARVLTMDASHTEHTRATVTVQEGRIAAIATHAAQDPVAGAGDCEIDAAGCLLMPGLVNAHFHSSVNHLRGSLDSLPLEVFMLYESPAEGLAADPRAVYVRTMLGALEMIRTGVTTVLDDAFFVPAPTPETIDAVMQAYADAGLRAVLALDQPNVPELLKLPYLGKLLPPELRLRAAAPPAMDAEGLLACYAHLLKRWHGAADGRLRAAVSCSAPQRVTLDYFGALDELSRSHHLPFYVHVLETKLQRVYGKECLGGRSLIHYVKEAGFLSDRLNIIHGIWLDDQDMDLIAEAGAVIAHNPISNLRLGSGVMPFRRLRNRGITICLGTDEAIADDAINMWAVTKLAGLIHNITETDYQQWPQAREILDCLIQGGARATRSPVPLGQVSVGYQADLILLDLDTLAFTPMNNLDRQLVYCESGSSVRMTMVAGRVLYERGRVTGIDEAAIRAEAREFASRRAATQRAALDGAEAWLPYYRQMYLRAAGQDVGMNRWVGGNH